ncbi:MAG: glycosyltransferase family 4 protein [Woeseiaceae bacterium]
MARVLITGPAATDPGGVAVYLESVTKHFHANNIEFDFLEIGSTRGRFLHPLADQLAFRDKIKKNQYDLVHINPSLLSRSFFRDGLLALQAKSRGLPVLVFMHGWSGEFEKQVERRWLRFFNATFGKADGFIVLASDFANKLKQWGIRAPIYRETTAVSDELIATFDLESKLANSNVGNQCRVLFLARLEPDKGVYETIDACALLKERQINILLTVAGDGPEAEQMRSYAESKLGTHVQFPGYVRGDSKVEAFSNAHVYAMPTAYAEGLPISLLEAMAFGLPVITRPVGGLKDVFIDGEHGFISESRDPAVIAAQLEQLVRDQALWRQISRNVHSFAKTHFVGSAVASELAEIYRNTMKADTRSSV